MSGEKIKQVNILFCAWNRDEIWETDYIVDTLIPSKYTKVYSHLPPQEIENISGGKFDVFVYNCRNNSYEFILSCVKKIKPKIIIHLSDEYYYENLNHWNDLANFCDLFLRQHHHPGFVYTENTVQIPLGYCNDAGLNGKKIIPSSKRTLDWSFLGDMKHDRKHMTECFKSKMHDFFTGCFISKERMVDIYLHSVFVPNGRGNSSLNCYRLYEASMCGAIPVVVGEDDEINETFKYEENPPWLFFESWEKASQKCYELLNDRKKLEVVQKNILDWWNRRIFNIHKKVDDVLISMNVENKSKKISFLQIGAFDGNDVFSTYLKENNIDLTLGIFVEPMEKYNEKIKESYKNFKNIKIINCAVTPPKKCFWSDDKNVVFYEHLDGPRISTTKKEHLLYHSQWFDLSKVKETCVEYTTIEKIFKENSIIECDWVVIDAEGIDAELVLSFDWESYNVSRIEFEHTHLDYNAKAVNAYLTSMGYVQVPPLNPDEDVAYENPRIIKQKDPKYSAQKLVNFPKIHYISVTDEVDRRSLLEKKFETYGIPKERLIPHIFDRYDDSKHNIKCEYNDWKLSIGSRGPVTSHLKAIRDWYENTDEPYAFFCEDDLSLETVKYWNFTWTEFFDSLPDNWDCIQLVLLREYLGLFSTGFRNRCWCDWSACAYLISRNHAKNLVENYYPSGSDVFYLDNKSVDVDGREEWAKIPVVETTLFSNFGDGQIYSCPLLVEDVVNCNSSYLNLMGIKEGQCDVHHEKSHEFYTNWWVTTAQYYPLEKIYTT